MVYLDNAATTRVCPEAAEAAVHMMTECFGNPSTTYKLGREAKAAVDKARGQIAKALGCQPDEVYFTSCGSEGDNWALISGARDLRRRGKHIISSAVEHDAVRKSLDFLEKDGYEITRLQPDCSGTLPLEAVRAALLHTDAVQGFLKVPFSAKTLGADMITISAHKIHAPKGIGALYIRSGLKLPPYILGGGQERGMRAGTEATPQIAAFGTAAEIGSAKMAQATKTMAELRAHAIDRLTAEVDGLVVIGGGSPHILSISLPGYRSEVLMNFLEARGIYTSKSSACKKGGRSHVLEAIGLPSNVIDGALRISFSRYTTREDIDALCDALRDAKQSLFPSLR